ncbi:hypothetical protein R0J90_09215 [Micrococcus sp. SIMBA_144]
MTPLPGIDVAAVGRVTMRSVRVPGKPAGPSWRDRWPGFITSV